MLSLNSKVHIYIYTRTCPKLNLSTDYIIKTLLSKTLRCDMFGEPREGLYDIIGGQRHLDICTYIYICTGSFVGHTIMPSLS